MYLGMVLIALAYVRSMDANLVWITLLVSPVLSVAFQSPASLGVAVIALLVGLVVWFRLPMVKE
jgi:hypothetical protein